MAESIQRIVFRRALAGQHPESRQDLKDWLVATVAGGNKARTPFEWVGKRAARRERGWKTIGSSAVPLATPSAAPTRTWAQWRKRSPG
jgi:hypothetical protein